MTELGLLNEQNQHAKIILKGDHQSAIALANNPLCCNQRTKHIDIQHHYIRDEVDVERIELSYVPTAEMVANGLTKPLLSVKFNTFVKQLGMASPTTPIPSTAQPPTSIVRIEEDENKDNGTNQEDQKKENTSTMHDERVC